VDASKNPLHRETIQSMYVNLKGFIMKSYISCGILMSIVLLFAGCMASRQIENSSWKPSGEKIVTKWASEVGPGNSLPEYPRPQMVRKDWKNLNGLWQYSITPKDSAKPTVYDDDILVPFCIESALSGVGKTVGPDNRLWYRRSFKRPRSWKGKRVKLNFGAVDWDATVIVNNKQVGTHKGGYDPFSFDITDALTENAEQEIIVSVWDPTNKGLQPRGKQVTKPRSIWYTAVTGIWQTVWIEPVSDAHIESIKIVPNIDTGKVTITANCTNSKGLAITIQAKDGFFSKGKATGVPGEQIEMSIKNPKLWSPDSPFLYDLKIVLKDSNGKIADRVSSYFGMRKTALLKDDHGIIRLGLNNEVLFQYGPLDQGWWPDGLYTAPTDEALRYDIEITKKLGFNMLRKHVKVEPARFYYWCDKLGILVWQDMPNTSKGPRWIQDINAPGPDMDRDPESSEQFYNELSELVNDFGNHPSIIMWVPFNESWGQFKTSHTVDMLRKLDPTRPINSASGGNFLNVGDVLDVHSYPNPKFPRLDDKMAVVCGEFGGLGMPVKGHTWQDEKNWGYRNYTDIETLTKSYLELLRQLRGQVGKGLAAAIYTQTSDVEGEVNGLMTYDRAIIKMDPELMRTAAEKLHTPPPIVSVVVPTSQEKGLTWKYTTRDPGDGWEKTDHDDSAWPEGKAGFGTKKKPGTSVRTEWKTSDIWIRRTFEFNGEKPNELQLDISHDEDAQVYLNSQLIAEVTGFATFYINIALDETAIRALKKGKNTLAIHCTQTSGDQYIDAGLSSITPQELD
jgi:hypothetical protein